MASVSKDKSGKQIVRPCSHRDGWSSRKYVWLGILRSLSAHFLKTLSEY